MTLRNIAKKYLPNKFIFIYRNVIHKKHAKMLDNKFKGGSTKDIFSTIYKENLWGTRDNNLPMSGHGSHDEK